MAAEHQESSGNVFEDLGFPAVESENLKIRSQLMAQLGQILESRGLKQREAAELLGVSQPRISDLLRGKIGKFSTDMLIEMLSRAGATVTVSVTETSRAA